MREALIQCRRVVLNPLAWYLSRRELRGLMNDARIADVVDATERYMGRGFYARIHAVQREFEIAALAELVQASRPKVIVEIGTAKGGTLFIWSRTNPDAELIVSLDLPEELGGYRATRRKLYREFVHDRKPGVMRLLQRDSHAPSTLEELKGILGGRPIDFLYIDADHSYEGVRKDYEMYGPLVRRGGLIAFHDIETRERDAGVHRLWAEIKKSRRCREIVQREIWQRPNYMGIGVVYVE